MSLATAAAQTVLLDLLHLNTMNSIALSADSMPATAHFCLKNPTLALRGLRAYRANAQEIAQSALQAAYPVMQQLLGEENFRYLAQDMWQALPPQRGDLAQWGHELAQYLPQVPQLRTLLAEHPYLCDVAHAEWALHTAATATDAQLDAQSFQLLAQADPEQLRLVLAPGCAVLRRAYPVVSILQLHDPQEISVHDSARQAIAAGEAQTALIWRRGFRPVIAQADAASSVLIETTLAGQSLAGAVDAAVSAEPSFDFSAWLSSSALIGLLCGVAEIQKYRKSRSSVSQRFANNSE